MREEKIREKRDLGVAVFACLGGRHLHNLARASLDHDVAILTKTGALGRIGV